MNTNHRAALVGDVVASRALPDQKGLLDLLTRELRWVNDQVPPLQPLQLTVGDEFQGCYGELPSALRATLMLALRLRGGIDLRFGIGWGAIEVLDPAVLPAGQSGEAWWSAREAVQAVSDLPQSHHWPTALRTRFAGGTPQQRALLNAHLICRDQILGRMDAKDAHIALGLFLHKTQVQMAAELGIGQPTVSARLRNNGPAALFRAQESLSQLLEETPA